MIRCEECLRANPPTRLNCMYCSVPLPASELSASLRKPVLSSPAKHELGYNKIVLPRSEAVSPQSIADAASLLKLKREELEQILAEDAQLPVALRSEEHTSQLQS